MSDEIRIQDEIEGRVADRFGPNQDDTEGHKVWTVDPAADDDVEGHINFKGTGSDEQ